MTPTANVERKTQIKIQPALANDPHDGKSRVRYNRKAESEFFVDNSALAGFTGERILYMAVRELIENSLDSCESAHTLPAVHISLKLQDSSKDK